jgi:hypothetical protein
MAEQLEVPANVPPDWRDWINEFPTMKSLAIFCFFAWILAPVEMTIIGWLVGSGWLTGKDTLDFIDKLVDKWLNALNWLTLAAVFGVVGKFATTKPDVIRAEGEVKAKTIVAAAQADAIAKTAEYPAVAPPKTMPEAAAALKAGVLAKTADPGTPIGELVDGKGD